MKIDLSKYPPGTKFKLCNGKIITLVGKSFVNDGYVIEYPNGDLRFRNQEGKISSNHSEFNIASVIQPDKYLVSYFTKSKELKTETILAPSVLTAETFLNAVILLNSPKWECFGDDSEYPVKILSWSKIEE